MGFDGFPDFVALNLASVGKTLAFDVHQHGSSALHVVDAKSDAVVPAEIEFGRVALQMLLADAVERAIQAALEDDEDDSTVFDVMSPREYSPAPCITTPCSANSRPTFV